MRERWFLLLLFALLVQLSGCGSIEEGQGLNTTWPDFAVENDFYAMENGNGNETAIGMEKNRRFRRSADSDLDDRKKELKQLEDELLDLEGKYNESIKELARKDKALNDAVNTRDRIKIEKNETDEDLIKLNENVKEKIRYVAERKQVYKDAIAYVKDLAGDKKFLEGELTNATAELTKRNNTLETRMILWRVEQTAMNSLHVAFIDKEKIKNASSEELATAKSNYTEFSDILNTYDEKIAKQTGLNEATGNIIIYEKYKQMSDDLILNTNKMRDEDPKKKYDDATKILNEKNKAKTEIENNEILNGKITEDFGTKSVHEVYVEKDITLIQLKGKIRKETNSTILSDLTQQREQIEKALKFIEYLEKIDKNKRIKNFIAEFGQMKFDAEQALGVAQEAFNEAKKKYDNLNKLIDDATKALANIKLSELKLKHDADKETLKILEREIPETKDKLDEIATNLGEPKGENSWRTINKTLHDAFQTKQEAFEKAEGEATQAFNAYSQKKTAVELDLNKISENEEKQRNDQMKIVADINDEITEKEKRIDNQERTDVYNAEKAMNNSIAEKEELEAKVGPADRLVSAKNVEYINAINSQETATAARNKADDASKKAKQKVETAKGNIATAKEKVVEAEALKAKEEEGKSKMIRNIAMGGGIPIAIIVLIAIGVALFFLVIKPRMKKAASVKQPTGKQEFDDPCGLTRVVRPGQPDQFVVKGKDIQVRGPLFRPKVHNKPLPMKHLLEGQEGGDKIDKIYFAKELNEGFFIGDGVEICEPDSVSVSEGKGDDQTAGSAKFEWDDGMTFSTRYKKEEDERAAANNGKKAASSKSKKSKKSSKSKRAKKSPSPSPQSAPSAPSPASSSADEKKPLAPK